MAEDLGDTLDNVVRIGADGEAVRHALAKLAENYVAHGWPSQAPSYAFVSSPNGAEPGRSLDSGFLLYQLAHMDMTLALAQIPSSVPLIGPLIDALKRPLHQLVLFYVNRIAAQSATASLLQAALIRELSQELQAAREALAKHEKQP